MPFDPHDSQQLDRYSRQLVLPQVGAQGQKALGSGRVLVVGAGGLGAPALTYLAAAGVGHLGVADGDRVELSNLPRQVLFTPAELGRSKAQSTARRLRAQNPAVEVAVLEGEVTRRNVQELVAAYDVVLDASDNFPTRFMLNDACRLGGKPLVHAGITHFSGQLTTFLPHAGPCYRCFFPQPPERGSVPNCSEGGILGPVAGILGTWQALEAIKLLLGATEQTLSGRLLLLDLWRNELDFVALPRDPGCPLCGEEPLITELLPDYEAPLPL